MKSCTIFTVRKPTVPQHLIISTHAQVQYRLSHQGPTQQHQVQQESGGTSQGRVTAARPEGKRRPPNPADAYLPGQSQQQGHGDGCRARTCSCYMLCSFQMGAGMRMGSQLCLYPCPLYPCTLAQWGEAWSGGAWSHTGAGHGQEYITRWPSCSAPALLITT